ncbi:MAG: hypothetical protein WAM86_12755 [Candidatus Sulfotelmatobacter sp.]
MGDEKESVGPEKKSKVALIFWILFFLSLFFNFWLWQFFAQTRPTAPDPANGRIYSIDNHGRVVYLTMIEYCAAYAHWVLTPIVAFALIVLRFIGILAKDHRKSD